MQGNAERVKTLMAELETLRPSLGLGAEVHVGGGTVDADGALTVATTAVSSGGHQRGGRGGAATVAAVAGGRWTLPASLTLALEPQMSRTILVLVRARTLRSAGGASAGTALAPREVVGSVTVNEVRNADVVKTVSWSTIVCFDQTSFWSLATAASTDDGDEVASSGSVSAAASRAVSRRP